MQVLIVTIAEAREHLSELIARVAAGDQVVIAENGKSVASLGRPPMFPTTPEEVEATRGAREEAIREWRKWRETEGPALPEVTTVQDLLDEQRRL